MLLSDLLYYANLKLGILKKSIVKFRIFLNPEEFKNILDECILLKYNAKYILNVDSGQIIMKNFVIIEKHLAYWQNPSAKINNEFAFFEYDFSNYWGELVPILTKEERIIKNIIE